MVAAAVMDETANNLQIGIALEFVSIERRRVG
jgi:hypothetical protein